MSTTTHVLPATEMSTTSQFMLVKPVPKRALSAGNRPGSPNALKPLLARSGSVSAPDPLGTRATRPPRGTVSKLTIVRLPQDDAVGSCGKGCGKSVRKHQRRKTLARTSGLQPESPTRISFASSSFSTPTSPVDTVRRPSSEQTNASRVPSASASSAPPRRSQAPSITRRHTKATSSSTAPRSSTVSQLSVQRPFERLLPAQIYDLAKSSSRPTANVLPAQHAPSSLFMQLPEDVYLPFLDRPSEVLDLFSIPANGKMMALFARMLPSSIEEYYPRSSAELAATVGSWTFEDFTTWLTQVSREEIDDAAWVRALRMFVLPKSEVLWARLKGLFGVPPELDVEPDFDDSEERTVSVSKKEPALNIVPIFPSLSSSGLHLDDISEVAEARPAAVNPATEVVGLRISTSTFSPRPSSASSVRRDVRTVPSSPRTRTPVHGYAPLVSSPLVPKALAQPRPRSAPPPKNVSSSTFSGRLLSRIRSKESACPMFPSSFDKLGIKPTLLHVA